MNSNLVREAWDLCKALKDILRRMDLQEDDPDAYNDKWRDKIEALLDMAWRRYSRRVRRLTE